MYKNEKLKKRWTWTLAIDSCWDRIGLDWIGNWMCVFSCLDAIPLCIFVHATTQYGLGYINFFFFRNRIVTWQLNYTMFLQWHFSIPIGTNRNGKSTPNKNNINNKTRMIHMNVLNTFIKYIRFVSNSISLSLSLSFSFSLPAPSLSWRNWWPAMASHASVQTFFKPFYSR